MKTSNTVLLSIAIVASSAPLAAQDPTRSVSGRVRDAAGQPIEGVTAEITTTLRADPTNVAGFFRLEGIPPGTHLLSLTKAGFIPRYVRFVLDVGEDGSLDLGPLVLEAIAPGGGGLMTLSGIITDSETGAPVPAVTVGINEAIIAVTDENGDFSGVAANLSINSDNRLTAQRIGYSPVDRLFLVPAGVRELSFDVELDPTSVELAEITVEAAQVSARLNEAGYYTRERSAPGHFFTADDIERMAVFSVSDIFRRVPGATVWSQDDALGAFGVPEVSVRFNQRSGWIGCSGDPILFVDDVRVPIAQLDNLGNPDRLAGVEVYTSTAGTPAEYAAYGAGNCGTIVMWTKDEFGRSPFRVGAHLGAGLADGLGPDRVGGQLMMPFRGPFSLYIGFTQSLRDRRSPSQAFLSMRFRPFGSEKPWYAATGVALNKPLLQMETHHLVVAGLDLPLAFGPMRPFTELHVTDPFRPSGAEVFGFVGMNLRIDVQ